MIGLLCGIINWESDVHEGCYNYGKGYDHP